MKALILSCNTGGGHNSAARAIAEEMQERGDASLSGRNNYLYETKGHEASAYGGSNDRLHLYSLLGENRL